MKIYEVVCELSDTKFKDIHKVSGNFYEVRDGYLDIYISEGEIAATFCPSYWHAIYVTVNDCGDGD